MVALRDQIAVILPQYAILKKSVILTILAHMIINQQTQLAIPHGVLTTHHLSRLQDLVGSRLLDQLRNQLSNPTCIQNRILHFNQKAGPPSSHPSSQYVSRQRNPFRNRYQIQHASHLIYPHQNRQHNRDEIRLGVLRMNRLLVLLFSPNIHHQESHHNSQKDALP